MSAIIAGTTPTIRINFKTVNVANITKAYLVLSNSYGQSIERDITTAEVGDGYLAWTLPQSETLALRRNCSVRITCDWLTIDGTRGRSAEMSASVLPPAKNEVIE